MPELQEPKTVEEAKAYISSIGKLEACTCVEDYVGEFRYKTSTARLWVASMRGNLLDPAAEEAIWAAAEQMQEAADELIKQVRTRERYEKAVELVGGLGPAIAIFLEGNHA